MRIVFMGTPQFAVYTLKTLTESAHELVGVVTSADKPMGRGKKLGQSAVKQFAVEHNLTLFQPNNLKEPSLAKDLRVLNADIFIVVAFRMLPKSIWSIPKIGTFNLHASLLPNYRGAAPINWAIINNETETGVTTFFIDEKIDTGAILLKESITIEPQDNAGTLHDKLAILGAELTLRTLNHINNLNPIPQEQTGNEKKAPKLTKENTKIDWTKPLLYIHNQIRGLNPYPTAWAILKNGNSTLNIKIFKADIIYEKHSKSVGDVFIEDKKMKIAHIEGYLICEELQLPNKKRMKVSDLLNGFSFNDKPKLL